MSSRLRRALLPAAACLVIAAGAGACTNTSAPAPSGAASTSASPTAPATPAALAGVKLPVQDYEMSPWELFQMSTARLLLTQECVNRLGGTMTMPERTFGGPRTLLERRWGDPDTDQARKLGYWLPGSEKSPAPIPSPQPDENALIYGEITTYKGKPVPEGGCFGEATRTLAGNPEATSEDFNKPLRATNDLGLASFDAGKSDPAVTRAQQAWSACMKAKGHDVPADVFSASNGLNLPAVRPQPAPGSAEVTTAVDDSQCVNSSGIIPAWSAAEITFQQQEIAKDPAYWEDIKRANDTVAANVRTVLTDRGQQD